MTDMGEIAGVLRECTVCRVGMQSQGKIYVVPMNFGYEQEGEKLTFYLHSAKVGRKIEALREEPEVCVELDCRHGLMEAELLKFLESAFTLEQKDILHRDNS